MQKIVNRLSPSYRHHPYYNDDVIRALDETISDMRRIRYEREQAIAKLRKEAKNGNGNGGGANGR